jgi:hypothetical protein
MQGVYDLVRNLQEGTFLLKKSLIAFLPDKPPNEENEACIFLLLPL